MMKANILLEQTKSLRCPGMGHQIRHLKLESNSYFVPDKPGKMKKDEHVLYTKLVTYLILDFRCNNKIYCRNSKRLELGILDPNYKVMIEIRRLYWDSSKNF